MKQKLIIISGILIIFSLTFSVAVSAKELELPDAGITPDSPLYFLKSWKERIQLFFSFNAEQKAEQYLHLAGVRLAEYQKMLEKNKSEIAEKTLNKYQNQLNRAIEKTKEAKNENAEELKNQIGQTAQKQLEILNQNLQKAPEQAKKGIENAIENSQKQIEILIGSTIGDCAQPPCDQKKGCTQEAKACPDGSYVGRTGPNCEFAKCPVKNQPTEKCGIQNCHGIDITCGQNIPDFCTEMYMAGDNCRQYASCQTINGKCELIKNQKFDNCKSCIEKCSANFPNNTDKFFECEGKCL